MKSLHQKNGIYTLVYLLLPLLLVSLVLSACGASKALTVPPKKAQVAAPGATATGAALSLPRGKGEVLYLTNKASSPANASGMFFSSRAYTVFALCTGTGTLTIQLAPQGAATFICSKTPQLQGDSYGNAQSPPPPENIQVQVTSEGKVLWEVSIQLHTY